MISSAAMVSGMMNSASIVINSFSKELLPRAIHKWVLDGSTVSPEPSLASGTEKVLSDYLLNESKRKTKREAAKPNVASLEC